MRLRWTTSNIWKNSQITLLEGHDLKGLCQLESMHPEVIHANYFQHVTFFVASKTPKFTEMSTSELGLDKGYFVRTYRTERFFSGCARSSYLNFFLNNKSVKTIIYL